MRKHWAAGALACALIATLPATLVAQTPASTTAQPSSTDQLAKWGLYARLVGQTMKSAGAEGFTVRWRWETPGEVLLEEWYRGTVVTDKPSYTGTFRLGAEPGTFLLKSSAMLGKEWLGTLQDDGSVNFVGKGLLKMPFRVRIDDQGIYEMADAKGRTIERYAAITEPATPVAVAETPSSSSPAPAPAPKLEPVIASAPTAPAPAKKPAPVVAKQAPSPPAPPIKSPRRLSEAELAFIGQSVQKSRASSIEQARQAELAAQEASRKFQLEYQASLAEYARREAENAQAEAEFEEERAQKAAAWQQQAQASEQALANSMQRLRDTTANIQAQQAAAQARQRAQADAQAQAERQRQVELIRQANQRQEDEAARLVAQRQQYEQQRAAAQAAETARQQQQQQQRGAGDVASAGRASTDTDANRCVSGAEVRENDTTKGNTAAYVSNGCGTPVAMKICLMTESGWKCGVNFGVQPQASWSFSAFHATGPVFVDAKPAASNRALASP